MKTIAYSTLLLLTLMTLGACKMNSDKQKGLVYFNDFETCKGWTLGVNLSRFPVYSGSFSFCMDSAHTYGPTLRLRLDDVSPLPVRKVKYSMRCYLRKPDSQAKIVISVDHADMKNILWDGKNLHEFTKTTGQWVEIKGECSLLKNGANKPDNIISVFPWNLSKDDIYIDDMRVEFVL